LHFDLLMNILLLIMDSIYGQKGSFYD
jgi:hypothetical protein